LRIRCADFELSEADMRHNTISGHYGAHHTVAPLFWVVAGIIVVVAFGDALAVLAIVAAIAAAAWLLYQEFRLERRAVTRNDTTPAYVTHFRPALTGRRDLTKTSAHASWRGRSAA
jgi:Flp pilus assembly protein TadB